MRAQGFIREVRLRRETVPDFSKYPFAIPAIKGLETLPLHPEVTILVGENGSGKSTLIEAIAMAAGFNPEGGSRNFRFATHPSESELHRHLILVRNARRERTGFFLRAESLFNVATQAEHLRLDHWVNLHARSHGEAFLWLLEERFGPNGLYVFDEPEAALSPKRQVAALALIHHLVKRGSQFIIATHSPLLMAYPGARLYNLDAEGIAPIAYEDTEHYAITKSFLLRPESYLRRLFQDPEPPPDE
jgi:predicted ATPase